MNSVIGMGKTGKAETTIGASFKNRDRLAAFGSADETLNDCLDRVLTIAEAAKVASGE